MKSAANPSAWGHYAVITPSDTAGAGNYADGEAQAIFVGGAGTVQAIRPDGTQVAFVGLLAGFTLPVRSIRVHATGTTATNLKALYNYKGSK